MNEKRIALVIPGVGSGGAERVMTEIANYLSTQKYLKITLISLTKGDIFYKIPENINYITPKFIYKNNNRILYTFKTFYYLRNILKVIKPYSLLSFGGKYNAFVILATFGLKIFSYVSDRSKPSKSYGKKLDIMNLIAYRFAKGIIVQTETAKNIFENKYKNTNISVIANPIREITIPAYQRENIILNVGRFIKSKNQDLLIKYFKEISIEGWRLIFIGDGKCLPKVKAESEKLGIADKVEFLGIVKDVDYYYNKCKIFAFTSISEGFPNSLGEAMSSGCACISFDCEAGPSDLIDNGINGFLVRNLEHQNYKEKLLQLLNDDCLREKFGREAKKKMHNFKTDVIGEKYLKLLLS